MVSFIKALSGYGDHLNERYKKDKFKNTKQVSSGRTFNFLIKEYNSSAIRKICGGFLISISLMSCNQNINTLIEILNTLAQHRLIDQNSKVSQGCIYCVLLLFLHYMNPDLEK